MAAYTQPTIVKSCFNAIIKEIWTLDAGNYLLELWVTWDPRAIVRMNGVNEYKMKCLVQTRHSEKQVVNFVHVKNKALVTQKVIIHLQ